MLTRNLFASETFQETFCIQPLLKKFVRGNVMHWHTCIISKLNPLHSVHLYICNSPAHALWLSQILYLILLPSCYNSTDRCEQCPAIKNFIMLLLLYIWLGSNNFKKSRTNNYSHEMLEVSVTNFFFYYIDTILHMRVLCCNFVMYLVWICRILAFLNWSTAAILDNGWNRVLKSHSLSF